MTTIRDIWGVVCPQCGNDDTLTVEVKTWADLYVDGTDVNGDREWGDQSQMRCGCGWYGTVGAAQNAASKLEKTDAG